MNAKTQQVVKKSIVLMALAVVAFFLVRASVAMAARYFDAREIQKVYTSELESLSEQEDFLQNQLDSLVTEEGLDFFVRDHYRVTKPGERLIVIVEDEGLE